MKHIMFEVVKELVVKLMGSRISWSNERVTSPEAYWQYATFDCTDEELSLLLAAVKVLNVPVLQFHREPEGYMHKCNTRVEVESDFVDPILVRILSKYCKERPKQPLEL